MQLTKSGRLARVAALVALVLVAIPYAVTAQSADTQTRVVSSTVSGQLNEQFAKHYLGLQVIDSARPVVIKMEYEPQHLQQLDSDAGFYVFKQNGFDRYVNASPPSETVFNTGGLETVDGVKSKVSQIGEADAPEIVTLVAYNDTTAAFSYTLHGENVRFVDDSGTQVVDGSAPAAPSVPSQATPVVVAPTATPASSTTGAVRSSRVTGQLNEQFAKHYLGVEVIDTGQPVTMRMDFEPQNSPQLDSDSGFYVFKQAGFDRYVNAESPSDTVFLTGSIETEGGIKWRAAEVGIAEVAEIVTIVTYNDTDMPLAYTLSGENIRFLDDSGEQVDGDRVAGTTPPPSAAAPTAAAPSAAATPNAGTTLTPGRSYTVQLGDTLGTISNQAYGTTTYWSAICNANSVANCDYIEVGSTLTIPTREQAEAYLAGGRPTPVATADAMLPDPSAVATAAPTADAMPAPTAEAMPEPTAEPTADAMPEPTAEADAGLGNLTEVAEEYEELDILLLALDLAALTSTIADGGPYTIFAPTNAAFASLPEARLDLLMADSALLADTLKYHVVSGRLTSTDLGSQTSLTTLQGGTISISSSDGTLKVEEVLIVASDVTASNGIIHFIHQLLPDPNGDDSQ